MKTIVNTIPGYRVYEYLLILSPHEELWNKITSSERAFIVAHELLHGFFKHGFKISKARMCRPNGHSSNFMHGR